MAQRVGKASTSGDGTAVGTLEAEPAPATGNGQVPSTTGPAAVLATRSAGGPPRSWRPRWRRRPADPAVPAVAAPAAVPEGPQIDLASNDPLVGYLLSAATAVDIRTLELDSPGLAELKAAGVVLAVPLISLGQPDRPAQPGPAAVRAGLLIR